MICINIANIPFLVCICVSLSLVKGTDIVSLSEKSEVSSEHEDTVNNIDVDDDDDGAAELVLSNMGIPKASEINTNTISVPDDRRKMEKKFLSVVKHNRYRDIISNRNPDQVIKHHSLTFKLTGEPVLTEGDASIMRKKKEMRYHPITNSGVDHGWLYFEPILSNKDSSYVPSATLKLYKKTNEGNYSEGKLYRPKISLNLLTSEFTGFEDTNFTEIQTKYVHGEQGRWEAFDLTSVVNFWLKYPTENYGILLTCDKCNLSMNYVLRKENHEDYEKLPYVQTNIDEVVDQVSGRDHRSIEEDRIRDCSDVVLNKETKRKQCCKHTKKINLANAIGYNVLSPRKVHMDFCKGVCTRGPFKNLRSLLQQQLYVDSLEKRAKNPTKRIIPGACCTPGKYQSLEILYRGDDGSTHVETKRDIIATECVCSG